MRQQGKKIVLFVSVSFAHDMPFVIFAVLKVEGPERNCVTLWEMHLFTFIPRVS